MKWRIQLPLFYYVKEKPTLFYTYLVVGSSLRPSSKNWGPKDPPVNTPRGVERQKTDDDL